MKIKKITLIRPEIELKLEKTIYQYVFRNFK
jgi:hypothetical protein